MIIEFLLLFLLGIAAGVACGLLPGLHVNNIGMIALCLVPALGLSPAGFAVFLVAMATAQTFVGFIPSIFLGVPDEDTVLSLLPTHRLLLEGRGMEAVRLTGIASLYGVLMSIALLPLAFIAVPPAYSIVRTAIVPILLLALFYLILREWKIEKILWAAFTILSSGYLGWVCLNIDTVSSSQVLLPMFCGLFGLSTLLTGMGRGGKSYKQDIGARITASKKSVFGNCLVGTIGGLIVGILPAMSPSQIGIMLQEIRGAVRRGREKLEDLDIRQFIMVIAALNAADALFSIFSLYLIGNPRSGISVILEDVFGSLDLSMLVLLCLVMLLSGLAGYKIHLKTGELFVRFADRIDLRKLSGAGFVFVLAMVFAMSGPLGLAIAFASMCVGLVPALTGVSRTHCMGCLMVPTILFFLGL